MNIVLSESILHCNTFLQPENENNSAKTMEQEIVQLHQAPQNQINLDSFNNLHQ